MTTQPSCGNTENGGEICEFSGARNGLFDPAIRVAKHLGGESVEVDGEMKYTSVQEQIDK